MRMDPNTFFDLLEKVKPFITKQDTIMRACITPEARLEATLIYLSTGCSYRSLQYRTRISRQSLSSFIPDTCQAIYNVRTNTLPTLQKYVNQVAVSGNIVQFGPRLTALSEVPILRTRAESDTPLGARFWRHERAFPLSIGNWLQCLSVQHSSTVWPHLYRQESCMTTSSQNGDEATANWLVSSRDRRQRCWGIPIPPASLSHGVGWLGQPHQTPFTSWGLLRGRENYT